MKTKIITILAASVILCFSAFELTAMEDKIFTSSGQILPGEEWGNVYIYNDDTIVDMLGGLVDGIATYDASTVNVTGGHINTFVALEFSTANLSGGYVYGLDVWDHATADFINNASVFAPRSCDFGTINTVSGIVDHIGAIDSGMLNLYGGVISNYLVALDSSVVNIFGNDLVKTSTGGHYGYGQVYGSWSDGITFTIDLNGSETYSHINLIPVIYAEIDIKPDTLNLQSKGKWLTCHIYLPEDCNVADVNSSSIVLQNQVRSDWLWFNEKQNVVMTKFNCSEIQNILEPGEVELTVSGHFLDGTYFLGTDTIKVINKGHKDN
ncbi:MAG: hypothetical protein ACYS18_04215 [Planctomycetota bacterium]|jgi:hypothetical protein